MDKMPDRLFAADDQGPVTVSNENGGAVRDRGRSRRQFSAARPRSARHSGNRIGAPHRLGHWHRCGQPPVAEALDATLVAQNYSRLVIDGNRRPGSETSIPEISEFTAVRGNMGLSKEHKAARVREIFRPYHDRIKTELDRRRHAGRPVVLIAMHSFTPVFKGVARPWHAGVLYNRDPGSRISSGHCSNAKRDSSSATMSPTA